MEAARDAADARCEEHRALLPVRRSAYAAAGGVRLAAIGLSTDNDIITTLNHDQLVQVINDPDCLLALHKSRVLPNTLPNGAATARGLASDRCSGLPNTGSSDGQDGGLPGDGHPVNDPVVAHG